MKPIFKSSEGERLVRTRYQAFLKHWPVPNEQTYAPTSHGATCCHLGSKGRPTVAAASWKRGKPAMWMGDVPALARAFRVYCIDVIGEPGLSAATVEQSSIERRRW